MKIEVVSHCWLYWRCLSLQLSSFFSDPPEEVDLSVTVFYSEEDEKTVARLADIAGSASLSSANVELNLIPLETQYLMRRAIGRNIAAKQTSADWVWFIDCDYLVTGKAMDRLGYLLSEKFSESGMVFPRYAKATSQPVGDEIIFDVPEEWDGWHLVDKSKYDVTKGYGAAIGGVQIVDAKICHEQGYLADHPKWHRPADTWQRTYEDPHFRKRCVGHRGQVIKDAQFCDGVLRTRHTRRGRFDGGLGS